MNHNIIHCTSQAQEQIKLRLDAHKLETGLDSYIEISIRHRGCSGLSYDMQFTSAPHEKDCLLQELGLCIKANSLMWVMGTHLDYQITDTSSGFIFTNPHQKRSCHCGEAFYL